MFPENSDLWADLPSQAKKIFRSSAQRLEFKRGDKVYQQAATCDGLYFIESGLVGLTMVGETSGKEHLIRFFKPGQFFGHRSLFSDEGHHCAAICLEATILTLVPKHVVVSVMEQFPHLYKIVISKIAKELRRAEAQRITILENQTLPRTARVLVYLKEFSPEHLWTRQEIANFSGSTTATVIRALAELEAKGFIEQNGRMIDIVNREALVGFSQS